MLDLSAPLGAPILDPQSFRVFMSDTVDVGAKFQEPAEKVCASVEDTGVLGDTCFSIRETSCTRKDIHQNKVRHMAHFNGLEHVRHKDS